MSHKRWWKIDFRKTFFSWSPPHWIFFSEIKKSVKTLSTTHQKSENSQKGLALFCLGFGAFHFSFFFLLATPWCYWCLMYCTSQISTSQMKRSVCRGSAGNATTLRAVANGAIFLLRKNEEKATRRQSLPLNFMHIAFPRLLEASRCLSTSEKFRKCNFIFTPKICNSCNVACYITSRMSLFQRCFSFFRSTSTAASRLMDCARL